MRICAIGPLYPWRGGIALYNTELVRAMKVKHDVFVVNFSYLYPNFLYKKPQIDPEKQNTIIPNNAFIHSLKFWQWRKSLKQCIEFSPTHVTIHLWHPFWYFQIFSISTYIKKYTKAQVICFVHNVYPHDSLVFTKKLLEILLKIAVKNTDVVVTHSLTQAKILQRLFPAKKIQCAPHPLYEPEVIKNRTKHKKLELLFPGFIRPYKGLPVLLRAISLVKHLPIHLQIAGESWLHESIADMVHTLHIENMVSINNSYIPQAELTTYFLHADLAVFPYIEASQSGMIQMALGHKVPVIVTQVPGLYEFLNPNEAFICPPNNAEALASIFKSLVNNPSQLEAMNTYVQKNEPKHTWQSLVHTLFLK